MLVLGMVGIPVAHLTTLAKPATWGFFLFDLKRALSWYWLFPIFACLIALARVISIVSQSKWNFSFLLALSFLLSPYVAAWSNWPAYSVIFPSLAFIVSHYILNSSNKIYLLVLGFILGVSLAGFVLVLYPPWNVPLGYVFLVLFAAYVHQNKLYKNIKFCEAGILQPINHYRIVNYFEMVVGFGCRNQGDASDSLPWAKGCGCRR